MFIVIGGGIAGLLTARSLRDRDKTIVIDRRRVAGKECTGIISRTTFKFLGIGKEYIEGEFKRIELVHEGRSIFIKTDIVKVDRAKLERDLASELWITRPVDAIPKGDAVVAGNEVYRGAIIKAWGWKGNAKWMKGIEFSTEPINLDRIVVYFDVRNVGGFSWIVPTPNRTLVGAISYDDPLKFIPPVHRRRLEVHGGAIPRVYPKMKVEPEIGDATGLIKTFTGGGIYGIGKLLFPLVKWMSEGESADYIKIRKALHKEVTRQYRLTRLLEVGWPIALNAFRLLKDREFQAIEEFDSHSKLLRLLLPL